MSLGKALWARRSGTKPAKFWLEYVPTGDQHVKVGELEFDGTVWTFRYDAEYKQHAELRPIEGFDELDRVYKSKVLFPFFAVRIPHLDRADVQRRIKADKLKDPGAAELLKVFGRKVLSSPAFELHAVSGK